jgi:hypothetical protein
MKNIRACKVQGPSSCSFLPSHETGKSLGIIGGRPKVRGLSGLQTVTGDERVYNDVSPIEGLINFQSQPSIHSSYISHLYYYHFITNDNYDHHIFSGDVMITNELSTLIS